MVFLVCFFSTELRNCGTAVGSIRGRFSLGMTTTVGNESKRAKCGFLKKKNRWLRPLRDGGGEPPLNWEMYRVAGLGPCSSGEFKLYCVT